MPVDGSEEVTAPGPGAAAGSRARPPGGLLAGARVARWASKAVEPGEHGQTSLRAEKTRATRGGLRPPRWTSPPLARIRGRALSLDADPTVTDPASRQDTRFPWRILANPAVHALAAEGARHAASSHGRSPALGRSEGPRTGASHL